MSRGGYTRSISPTLLCLGLGATIFYWTSHRVAPDVDEAPDVGVLAPPPPLAYRAPPRNCAPHPPHNDGPPLAPFDAAYAAELLREHASTPPFLHSAENGEPCRIALTFYGRVTEVGHSESLPQLRRLTALRWASIQRLVLEPARALRIDGDVRVDTFVYLSSDSRGAMDVLTDVIRPTKAAYGASPSMTASAALAVLMPITHARRRRITYDRVLLLRNDVMFFEPLPWTRLHPKLFYATNWCRAVGPIVPHSPQRVVCRTLSVYSHDTTHNGVPDFMFVGSVADMVKVFVDIIDDMAACRTRRTSSCCGHAIFGGQILSLYNRGLLKVGRFMHHHLDYDFVRSVDPSRLEVMRRNATWVPARPNGTSYVDDVREWEPRRWSTCTPQRAYCREVNASLTSGFMTT